MTEFSFISLLVIVALTACAAVTGYLIAQTRAHGDSAAAAAAAAAESAEAAARVAQLREQLARTQGQLETERAAHEQVKTDLDWQREQNSALDKKIEPMRVAFKELTERVQTSDAAQVRAQTELKERVAQMVKDFGQATADVRIEARRLSTVLSRNDKRGAWGEMQLRNLVESSGMLPHVHFVEQDHTTSDDKVLRPDMVITLAGGRSVIVDSKVPLDAFLRMDGSDDDQAVLSEHARLVQQHIHKLSEKEYWRRYNSPEFVIMFLPSESLLGAALEIRPDLVQLGLDRKVFLATPMTMMAMLHTITHSWKQVEAADQAREIQQLGAEFYGRMLTMADKFEKLRKSLGRAVVDYNGLVGSVETRVLPSGRKMENLSIAEKPIPALEPVEEAPRTLNEAIWPDHSTDIRDPQLDMSDPHRTGEPRDSSAA
ncbi:MAG: DNA recombination protein RmuC [Candidatus Nanopelagicales bacterium]